MFLYKQWEVPLPCMLQGRSLEQFGPWWNETGPWWNNASRNPIKLLSLWTCVQCVPSLLLAKGATPLCLFGGPWWPGCHWDLEKLLPWDLVQSWYLEMKWFKPSATLSDIFLGKSVQVRRSGKHPVSRGVAKVVSVFQHSCYSFPWTCVYPLRI